jgi:transcriptional regulator GlxA family with amidase domain
MSASLARQFLRELGMSFGEWRLRLRFLRAIEALEAGTPIQAIAFDLGYSRLGVHRHVPAPGRLHAGQYRGKAGRDVRNCCPQLDTRIRARRTRRPP